MTTVRLTTSQKLKVRKAAEILRSIMGRNVTQGETVAALADFALRHRELLADMASEATFHREAIVRRDKSSGVFSFRHEPPRIIGGTRAKPGYRGSPRALH